jgi:voltage-gated potassium channel
MPEETARFRDTAVITNPPRLQRWEERVEWPLATIAIIFLAVFSVQVLANPQGQMASALDAVLWVTWAVFAVDYGVRLYLAKDRWHWFRRHLLDLAVVSLPLLRPLRLLRLLVLFSALQKAVGGAIRGRVVVYTAFSSVLLIYVASLAILEVERGKDGSTINSFGDAVWWAITTVTTVGYGDLSPTTTKGKVIAVFLMLGGISLVGMVTATLASWIIQQVGREDSANHAATAAEFDALRADMVQKIDLLSAELRDLKNAASDPGTASRVEECRRHRHVPGRYA